jgi:hypothetical protein
MTQEELEIFQKESEELASELLDSPCGATEKQREYIAAIALWFGVSEPDLDDPAAVRSFIDKWSAAYRRSRCNRMFISRADQCYGADWDDVIEMGLGPEDFH